MSKITTDFVGTETAAVTKQRLTEILEGWAYDPGAYTTWGNARSDMNALLSGTAIGTIGATEIAGSFLPKINALNDPTTFVVDTLFASGEDGAFSGNPFEAFTNTAGTTPATWGDSVARTNDRSGNGRNAVQASAALRSRLGRAPVAGRRNVHPRSFGIQGWSNIGGSIATSSATEFDSMGDPFAIVTAGDGSLNNSFSGLSFPFPDGTMVRIRCRVRRGTSDRFYLWFRRGGSGAGTARVEGIWDAEGLIFGDIGEDSIEPRIENISATDAVVTWGFVTIQEASDYAIRLYGGGALSDNPSGSAPANPNQSTLISEMQVVTGSTTIDTPYQRVASSLNITEQGVPSPAFIRFDLSDDVLPTVFPDGLEGNLMVFGRKGSWIERDVSIAPGGNLNIGPTSITGGPSGLLAALGDIVGWAAVDRTLSDTEVSRLVSYYRGRGAKGLLVPGGPELVLNSGGPFVSLDDWQLGFEERGTAEVLNGAIRMAHTTSAWNIAAKIEGLIVSQPHLISVDGEVVSGTAPFMRPVTAVNGTSVAVGGYEAVPPTVGSVFVPDNNSRLVQFRQSAAGVYDIFSVSVRELRPQEDW